MTPEDVELITGFKKISELMPGIAFDFIMGTLSPEKEHEFGQILIMLGEILSHRAKGRALPEQLIDPSEGSSLTKRIDGLTERSHMTDADNSESQ